MGANPTSPLSQGHMVGPIRMLSMPVNEGSVQY
jgi:hypothetical protein